MRKPMRGTCAAAELGPSNQLAVCQAGPSLRSTPSQAMHVNSTPTGQMVSSACCTEDSSTGGIWWEHV